MKRREFFRLLGGGTLGLSLIRRPTVCNADTFRFQYVLASSMYGRLSLTNILPEVAKTGACHIDIWPEGHANQREQMEQMGQEAFTQLLWRYRVGLGILTRYDLGPFTLQSELQTAQKLGARMVITGSRGPGGLKGADLKLGVQEFVKRMKPHLEVAEATGVVIGIENHGGSLISSPDAIKWLVDLSGSPHLGIALAPYHLPQDAEMLGQLVRDLGSGLVHFYAWQHGMGCARKLPKEQEMLQLPGRGPLDFRPMAAGLKAIDYAGWISIFMHPVPRGIPILPSAEEVTGAINQARKYFDECLV